ncbi:MAG TPA: alpha-glucan family phosphorylase [Kofleriaceae bacterium]|nr:alpha-glucan family phosphorylase [Kofleriaceae bacterium]
MTVVDPICGMPVDPATAPSATLAGQVVYFCSDLCRRELFRRSSTGRPVVHEARPSRRFAYLSMEIAIDPRIPSYSGGLGVLAGDMLKSFADLRIPVVAVTLLYRKGYFAQRLDRDGRQLEQPVEWQPERVLTPLPERISVSIEGRTVAVQIFEHEVIGLTGYVVPILFLDTQLPENDSRDRDICDVLYGGDEARRLAQEIVLGIGAVRALRACGYSGLRRYHLNEGHAALAALELLEESAANEDGEWNFQAIRKRCVFTTHTPVPAGHDQFGWSLVRRMLGDASPAEMLSMLGGSQRLNMTLLALNASHFVNGVARKHGEVSEHLFPGRDIRHITNGVHSQTWTSEGFRTLFDTHVPEWRDDPAMLRKAMSIPAEQIWSAHQQAKQHLLAVVRERTGRTLGGDVLTLGFARRATPYKRAELVLQDVEGLRTLGRNRLQLIFSGKAHPRDVAGKDLIARIVATGRALGDDVPVIYLEDYDLELAKLLVAGSDVWLNTPQPPLEASGTSGMKAAHNGVPSLSVLDGWWLEGCIEGVTGWAIAPDAEGDEAAARALHDKLASTVLPTFYDDRARFLEIMRHAIAINASYFNTHRVVQQYVTNAYAFA